MGTSGLQVFVFTDVVGSTRLWAEEPDAMRVDLAEHDSICREAAGKYEGEEFANAGDSFGWYFADVASAVAASIRIQQRLEDAAWLVTDGIRVRIGVHVGVAQHRAGNVFGPVLNETARIMSTGHGGQIVVSDAVASLLDGSVTTRLLGELRLRDLDGEWRLHQVDVPGVDNDHPPLRGHRSGISTLPSRRTALLGRDPLVSTLIHALEVERLVTLVGPGGAGKTHTATEAAGRAAGRYNDGVHFVDQIDGLGGTVDDVFAVVDHQQGVGPCQRRADVAGRRIGPWFDQPPDAVDEHRGHLVVGSSSGQIHEVDAVVVATGRSPGSLGRRVRLPGTVPPRSSI